MEIYLSSLFFFSSRRRHTRCGRDWSSDVCSSDLFQIVHRLNNIKILPRAAGAGNEVNTTTAQAETFQNIKTDFDFLNRVCRERNPNGVADTVHQQHAQPNGRLDGTRAEAAGFSDTEMQRLFDLGGNQPIGRHRHKHFRGLQAHLEILEIVAVQNIDVAHCRLNQRLRGRFTVLTLQRLLERTGIYADTDWNIAVFRRIDDGTYPIIPPNVR